MTDIDIVKALECCKELSDCGDCRYGHLRTHNGLCIYKMQKDALDLINRKQAEIERLQNESIGNCELAISMRNDNNLKGDCSYCIDKAKSEAIKELEAKIHEKLHQAEMHGNFEPVVTREMFDSVVKEVVGEGNV